MMNRRCPVLFFRIPALLFFSLFSLSYVFAQSHESAVIIELSGTVEIKTAEASFFTQANVGDQVWEDTIISTGFRSDAHIEAGSTLIVVRPLTRMSFTEIRSMEGAESLNINLQAGRIRVDLNPPAGTRASLDVVSPVAVASVRGTSFEFDTKTLRVNNGQVSFMGSAGQRVTVSAGSTSTPSESGRVWNPVIAGSSALRPSPPAGMQPNTPPAPIAIASFGSSSSDTGSDQSGGAPRDEGYESPGEGDTGFDFRW